LKTFSADEGGNVAMLFGALAFVTFTFVGAAVDMGRWLQARKTTMEAMDAGALAGLRNFQDTGNVTAAQTQALRNYQANIKDRATMATDNVSFQLTSGTSEVSMKAVGNATYRPIFLSILPAVMSIKELPLLKKDNSEHPVTKLAVGKNAGTSLEIAMMLDITGSMSSKDSTGKKKIDSLKEASQKLLDIVIWADQSKYTSKVSVIPFSEGVNLGTTWQTAVRSTSAATIAMKNANNSNDTWRLTNNCVVERTGAQAYTDASHSSAKIQPLYNTSGTCPTKTQLMPLTNDKAALKARITGIVEEGTTAGQIGTAWAWYTLSPNFNALWNNAMSNARPYGDLNVMNELGRPVLSKIAVLMTDGAYNTQYCSGVPDKNSTNFSATDRANCTAQNGSSNSQALSLCSAMKAKGIVVYTIGFMVTSAERTLLTTCATSPEHFFNAEDGNQLTQAFTNIAYKLVPPYLAN
jgi:Flp pilus assembly protein TadG